MDKVEIVKATEDHARFVSANLHEDELSRISDIGITPEMAIMGSFHQSEFMWSAVADDGVICMWGVKNATTLLGCPQAWMITTTLLDKYTRHFIRVVKPQVYDVAEQFGELEAFVDSRHTKSLRFFEWLGFKIERGLPVGPKGVVFNRVSLRVR